MSVSVMRDEIASSFGRILSENCTPQMIRSIEAGGDHRPLWDTLERTGFADALVPSELGGAGLSSADAFAIIESCGANAVPLAFAETVVLRGALTQRGFVPPSGSLTFVDAAHLRGDGITVGNVVCGKVADWAVMDIDGEWRLLPTGSATVGRALFVLDASLGWPPEALAAAAAVSTDLDLRIVQAFVHAAQLSGALNEVFVRTLNYANERRQFGRSIGTFQAIQQQLSVMAEHVFAARMAADVAASRSGLRFDRLKTAIAKARASEAAAEVAALSHSIHGAIGFTEEYDLQLFTRRLYAWRLGAGSESYWHDVVGDLLLRDGEPRSLDFLRQASQLD
jgi:acyl-CoA dehydrogenase